MNYRHAYHAGNPADVLKHAILAWVLRYLNQKAAPYAVIDTHAGIGAYDLKGEEALRTGEWVEGIGRLWQAELPEALAAFAAPYLAVVRDMNPDGRLRFYPGSPAIAQELCRLDERIVLSEKHPADAQSLAANMARDPRVKVLAQDGWLAPKALLPPKERRGLTLIDPPFEEAEDFDRALRAIQETQRRFATGMMLLWYPVKDAGQVQTFHRSLQALNLPKWLDARLMLRPLGTGGLPGSGVFIVNPPFGLHAALLATAPHWADTLAAPAARLIVEAREG